MIIVVDTNILFSACITAEKESRLSTIIFSRLPYLKLISCYYTIAELFKHQERLIKASKLSKEKFTTLFYGIIKQIDFYNEDAIDQVHWQEADRLTRGIDSNDITFVALALQTDGLLWTGDKKLSGHLRAMGLDKVVNTAELADILNAY